MGSQQKALPLGSDVKKVWLISTNKSMRQPGIEPGSIAWKATMLTFTPPTL